MADPSTVALAGYLPWLPPALVGTMVGRGFEWGHLLPAFP